MIRKQYGDSSNDQVATTTEKYLGVNCHLPNNLGDSSKLSQHSKMTDASTCSNHSRVAALSLMLSQTRMRLIVGRKTYRGNPKHGRPMRCRLEGRTLNSGQQAYCICLPSIITTLIFRVRPWTTSRVCAAVICASSSVSRSSRWSTASTSFPGSLLTSFSALH